MDERTIARFWSKVNKDGPVPPHRTELGQCWVWTGARNDRGYGVFPHDGTTEGAHRVSMRLAGNDPGSRYGCHHCDNPSCVNPEHLFVGSGMDNTRDMISKGRGRFPSRVYPTRIDLRISPELSALIAKAADLVGDTERSWSRAALLRATCYRWDPCAIPPGGNTRLAVPMGAAHRAVIDDAVEQSGIALSDWARAVLARAAEGEISEFSAGAEESTQPEKKEPSVGLTGT